MKEVELQKYDEILADWVTIWKGSSNQLDLVLDGLLDANKCLRLKEVEK